jgi:hypothetical protein
VREREREKDRERERERQTGRVIMIFRKHLIYCSKAEHYILRYSAVQCSIVQPVDIIGAKRKMDRIGIDEEEREKHRMGIDVRCTVE